MAFSHQKAGRGSSGHGVALFAGAVASESANATNLQITTAPGLSGATPYTLSPQPVVTAKKSFGTTDTAYVTNVVASLNVLSGSPVLSGTTTKTPVSGVATFTDLVVTGAGTWTLTFASGSLASAVSGTGTTTSSSAATKLTITTAPGLSGATPYTLSPQPVVAAQNGSSVTDTSYVTNVVAALNVLTGSPVLSGTTTKAAVSGVATFTDLVVTGAGTWTITFTSGTLTSATSSTGTTTGGGFVTITDSFTGTNGTALAGRTTDTGSKTWVLDNGVAGAFALNASNQVACTGTTVPVASVDAAVADCTVSATMVAFPANQGLAFRVVDGTNFLRLNVATGGDTIFIQSVIAGVGATLATLSTTGLLSGDTLAVVLSGPSIVVKINGTTKGSTSSSQFQTATKHGLCQIGATGGVWDTFSITVP